MSKASGSDTAVVRSLLSWYTVHGRHALPWRRTREPYHVLVSELMLQQTQVARVVTKYEQFITTFPSMEALADGKREDVLRHWQGLGYNSRAARLHALASMLRSKPLPKDRESLLALPGIGPYTAGAIMIFAYGKPAVSIDVNVARVLKRVFWASSEHVPAGSLETKSLRLLTESRKPHHWHAALMDFGSAICTARNPACAECPIYTLCRSKGVRPEESLRKKQAPFAGSKRWWRGRILAQVLAATAKEHQLLYRIKEKPSAQDEDMYLAALRELQHEGLVLLRDGYWKIS